ncbi:MAG: accessory gene regulator B family protein [Bacilli bacterium]|nr:accessory gene regulator B family protein [Bacilli bacterium]
MKDLVIDSSLNVIKKYNPSYSNEKIEEIKYGLSGLYLTITKTIFIVLIAFVLGIVKELIIFTLIYNIIRMPSFGLHAKSSIACLISSTIMFIGLPYLCSVIIIPFWLKLVPGFIGILLIAKNSPADTEKRPIVNPKRRKSYKIISTVLAIIFVASALIIPDNFLSNCFILSLVLQCFVTAPAVYKLFKMPYDNYKKYTV